VIAATLGGCRGDNTTHDQPAVDSTNSSVRSTTPELTDPAPARTGSVAGRLNQTSEPPTGEPTDQLPFDRELVAAIGYEIESISGAAREAQLDAIAVCLTDHGWTISDRTMNGFRDSPLPPAGTVAHFRLLIAPPDNSTEIDPVWQNPQFSEQAQECEIAALEALPNPVDDLSQLLEDATQQISDRARADERYISAQAAFRDCAEDSGYAPEQTQTLLVGISEDGAEIIGRFRSGAVTENEALRLLDELELQEERAVAMLDKCGSALLAEERVVVAELQEDFLRSNPGFILGLSQQLVTAVDRYREYLPSE